MTPTPLPLPPAHALLTLAEGRLRRQRGYARPLAGRAAHGLECVLEGARSELAARATPAAVWRAVAARPDGDAVTLDGVRVAVPRLAQEVAAGATPGVWLCTLGLDDAALRAALEGDALRAQVTADLAQQMLFATARAAHAALAGAHPGHRVLRVALRGRGERLWDAAAVLRLLPVLGPAPLGVGAPDGTALAPAHSLLGVAVLRPDRA